MMTDSGKSIYDLRQALARVREASLLATRRGDYRQVARLTAEAAKLNRQILGGEPSERM